MSTEATGDDWSTTKKSACATLQMYVHVVSMEMSRRKSPVKPESRNQDRLCREARTRVPGGQGVGRWVWDVVGAGRTKDLALLRCSKACDGEIGGSHRGNRVTQRDFSS